MAEVWLARALGSSGFQKRVVLKTILPALQAMPQFTEMFVNEAKVAALLNHPNCVQIFDLGEENGALFIAMEFIEGFSLSRLLRRAEAKGPPLPLPVLARIVMEALSGLEYAHHLTDPSGLALNLVHRDISPDNLLVSFAGQTKVVDFGIAKAAVREGVTHTTRTGTVKGKYGYMAPEYLQGLGADGRSDLFALGVVLYRCVTGQKPFQGATDAMVTKAVLDATPPRPTSIRPELPAGIDEVVMTALEKDPALRFQSAKQMREALASAVGHATDNEGVSSYLEQLWPKGDPERHALEELAAGRREEPSDPVLEQVVSEEVELSSLQNTSTRPTSKEPALATPSKELPQMRPARRKPWLPLGLGVAVLALCAGVYALYPKPQLPPPPVPLPVVAQPAIPVVVTPEPAHEEPAQPTKEPEAEPAPAPRPVPAKGKVKLQLTCEPNAHVFFRGHVLGVTPLATELPPGKQTLRFAEPTLGLDKSVLLVVGSEAAHHVTFGKGTLEVRVSPWANVKLDGKPLGQTPVAPMELYEGVHKLELSNPELKVERTLDVKLAPGEKKTVRESLEN